MPNCSYDQLPINAPKCPFHLNSEGAHADHSRLLCWPLPRVLQQCCVHTRPCGVNTADNCVLRRAAGAQNFTHNVGEVNYWGSSKHEDPGAKGTEAPTFKHAQAEKLEGLRVKEDIGDNGELL